MITPSKSLTPTDEVRTVLQEFQDGYTKRDLKALDAFMELFSADEGLEVIGTSGLGVGREEWCLGRSALRRLVENDWQYWGNLVLDVKNARIHVQGDTAWLATDGTVTYVIEDEEFIRDTYQAVSEIIKRKEGGEKAKLLHIQREIAEMLHETGQGDKYLWPLRFTAVLIRQQGLWCFQQIHFSHATARLPDVRLPAK